MKVAKELIGKLVKITWDDPQSEIRTTLKEFLEKPLAQFESYGIIRHIGKTYVILSSEKEVNGEVEDLTSLHKQLIKKVKVIDEM